MQNGDDSVPYESDIFVAEFVEFQSICRVYYMIIRLCKHQEIHDKCMCPCVLCKHWIRLTLRIVIMIWDVDIEFDYRAWVLVSRVEVVELDSVDSCMCGSDFERDDITKLLSVMSMTMRIGLWLVDDPINASVLEDHIRSRRGEGNCRKGSCWMMIPEGMCRDADSGHDLATIKIA